MRAAQVPTCIIFCMHIIPVIDLQDGRVVAARHGQRHLYQPLATPLCAEPELQAVTRAYLSVFPFRTFYLADLNAITGNGDNHNLIAQMLETWPGINLWLDSGLQPFVTHDPATSGRVHPVLGTETGITIQQVEHYTHNSDCILSLDYAQGQLLGDPDLLRHPDLLPQRVISMCLDRVGSHGGPDLERLRTLREQLPGKQLYAAGGVRNVEDLHLLAANGSHGALLASALHDGTLGAQQVTAVQRL